jgi:signal transduction histidine kinase
VIRRLDATVSDALRVARSGQVNIRPIDLRESLSAAVDAATPSFHERGATLDSKVGNERLSLDGDPDALEQLFLNLLINAAEALDAGGTATVLAAPVRDELNIRIRDDGPGMPPEVRERAFEPLFSTRIEGTGLGLPISRRIAVAHGGEIRIESTPGSGTTVVVRLPRSVPGVAADSGTEVNGPRGSDS